MVRGFFGLLFKLFYRLEINGLEHAQRDGVILASNHCSHFDPPVLAASWPRELHFLARQSLFDVPILRHCIPRLNAHPLQRGAGDRKVFKTIEKLLREGLSVVLFPEGTRSLDGQMGEFKAGVGMLSLRTGAPVVPVYLGGTHIVWNRKKKFPKFWGKLSCSFGNPIDPKDFENLSGREAQEALIKKLKEEVVKLAKAHSIHPPS